jgi:hypothetical protein
VYILRRIRKFLDQAVRTTAIEIDNGQYEADLGAGVVKKRVAYPGRGKSGSARVIVAHLHKDAIIFITGRDKSDPGRDFTDAQVEATKEIAKGLQKATAAALDSAIKAGILKEITYDP